jgi:hypothetical protein
MLPTVPYVLLAVVPGIAIAARIMLKRFSKKSAAPQDHQSVDSMPDGISPRPGNLNPEAIVFEMLCSGPHELEEGTPVGLERIQRNARGDGHEALGSAMKKADEKLRKAPDSRRASTVEETEGQLLKEASVANEDFTTETAILGKSQPSWSAGEPQAWMNEQRQNPISGTQTAAPGSTVEFSAVANKPGSVPANGQLISYLMKMQERAQDVCARADAAADKVTLAAESAATKLNAIERAMEGKLVEVEDRLQRTADDLLQSLTARLVNQAGESMEPLSAQLRGSEARSIEETEKRLARITETSVNSLTNEAKAVVAECGSQLRQTVDEYVASSIRQLDAHHRDVL